MSVQLWNSDHRNFTTVQLEPLQSNDTNFSHNNTQHWLSRKGLNHLTTLFRHVVCFCLLFCKFALHQKCFDNECCKTDTEYFFCVQRCCVWLISFDHSSNSVEFVHQRSLAKCLECDHSTKEQHATNGYQMLCIVCVKSLDHLIGVYE